MATFEINSPEPIKVSEAVAQKILDTMGRLSIARKVWTVEDILSSIPEIKALDDVAVAIEDAYNDCNFDQDGLIDLEGDNLDHTMESLSTAFTNLTGKPVRLYDISADPGEGSEPEDDEIDEEETK